MNACVIFNPSARGDKARRLRAQLDVIARDAALKPTARAGDAHRLAAEALREGFDTIVAAGGDGTVNEVLNGIAQADGFSRARLGVLPMGTVNVFAKELRLPEGFDEAWQTIQRGRETWIDAPRANYMASVGTVSTRSHSFGDAVERVPTCRYFAQMAGAGLDARAVELVSWELKKRIGYFAYVIAALQAFTEQLPLIEVTSGNERVVGQLVLIGNGKFYGGRFSVFPLADLCDGLLEVVVYPSVTIQTLLRSTWGAITDDFHTGKQTIQFKSSQVKLHCAAPISFHLDGENAGPLPVTFSVERRALRVIVP